MSCSRSHSSQTISWNARAAAHYLDQREISWAGWPGSARDHDTFCVSCHTVLPYAISRPFLRAALDEQGPNPTEHMVIDNVAKRVRFWNAEGPYYTDEGYGSGKAAESRGTEAVLNAVILANTDVRSGTLSDITKTALSYMWTTQLTEGDERGAWAWLHFGMEPWEASDSQYYGAALAALAVGIAPEDYRSRADIQPNLKMLRDFLNRQYPEQSIANDIVLLWASTKLPNLVEPDRRTNIIDEIRKHQRDDGGWALSRLVCPKGWSLHAIRCKEFRTDWTLQETGSDGYATGLITFVLQTAGFSTQDPTVARGIAWLRENQNEKDGSWPSWSLYEKRSSTSNVGHFMRDAATAYAVLALTAHDASPATAKSDPTAKPVYSRRFNSLETSTR